MAERLSHDGVPSSHPPLDEGRRSGEAEAMADLDRGAIDAGAVPEDIGPPADRRGTALVAAAAILFAILILLGLFGRIMTYPMRHDELMHVSPAVLLGQWRLYNDMGYNHLPNLPLLLHAVYALTGGSMLLLGEVLGRKAEAEAFVKFWRAQLAVVADRLAQARPEAPTVFLENRVGLSEGCCDTMVGLVGKLLDAAGAQNVARGLVPGEFGTLNPEFLIARQPRLYIGTGIGTLATAQQTPLRIVLGADATPEAARASLARAVQRRGIAQLQAVKEGRAYAMWHHFYNSPFNVVAVQVFAKWLHPSLFADLDPRATLQTMYERFQPIPLEGVYWTALKP